jgi:hypothetical protein
MRGRYLPNKNKLLKGWYFKMTKTTKKCASKCAETCVDNCACAHVDAKRPTETAKAELTYSFYSRVLNKPFDSLSELQAAEDAHFAELKAKEDKVAQKKADAMKVEDAFKALNAARKTYKENLIKIADVYSESLKNLKTAFDDATEVEKTKLAAAEDNYKEMLKAFTDKYESYHLTLKDGDFETTISGNANQRSTKSVMSSSNSTSQSNDLGLVELFNLLFN